MQGAKLWRPVTAALILVGAAAFALNLLDRSFRKQRPPVAAVAAPTESIVAAPVPLSRADLIEAAEAAANAFATGSAPPAEVIRLAGQSFRLELPFGCEGASSPDSRQSAGYSYDQNKKSITAHVAPESWTTAPWIQSVLPATQVMVVEGFWIDRPWLKNAVCPTPIPSADIEQGESIRQTLAIAQAIAEDASRDSSRSGKAYSVTVKNEPGLEVHKNGLLLVVSGRLSADPVRVPIACWSDSTKLRPICTIWARFDKVEITSPSGETRIGEWGG